MALKLNEEYPGRFNNPSAEYPQGSFKNRTTPTSADGSYFEQKWANDQLAFFSSLLSSAGMEANGQVDKVGASQYYEALETIIEDSVQVPSYLATSGVGGASSNLKCSASGSNSNVSISANSVCLKQDSGEQRVVGPLSATINSASIGANGLDVGVIAVSTWYAVYIIWNGSSVAGLISLSSTSPVMPAGYTHKARIGWIRTDSTANKYPLAFKQYGRLVQYVIGSAGNISALPVMASGVAGNTTTPVYAAVSASSFVPATAAKIYTTITQTTRGASASCAPNDAYGNYFSTDRPPANTSTYNSTGVIQAVSGDMVLESSSIYWASSGDGGRLLCRGWEDNL